MRVARRVIIAGVAVAAVFGGFFGGVFGVSGRVEAQCRAFLGSRNDGVCLDGPSGQPGGVSTQPGIPWVGIGPTDNGGPGISTGPLFPGQTINVPLAP